MPKLPQRPHPTVPFVDGGGRVTEPWLLYLIGREKAGLSNLSDVSSAAPINGSVLTYNADEGVWEPE